jgi:DNA polymerase-4
MPKGYDYSPVRENGRPLMKGLGNSTTIAFDVEDKATACLVLLSLAETVASRLRQAQYCTQLISVSLKTNEFSCFSHQRKIHTPTDCTNTIYHIACELFDELWKGQPIRHLGIRTSEFCKNTFIQLTLFEKDNEKLRAVDHAVDKIRFKFGSNSMFRASFLHSSLPSMTGGTVSDEEYPMMSSQL